MHLLEGASILDNATFARLEFLAEQMEHVEEYNESLVRRMVEKFTVCEEKFIVEFKSGMA